MYKSCQCLNSWTINHATENSSAKTHRTIYNTCNAASPDDRPSTSCRPSDRRVETYAGRVGSPVRRDPHHRVAALQSRAKTVLFWGWRHAGETDRHRERHQTDHCFSLTAKDAASVIKSSRPKATIIISTRIRPRRTYGRCTTTISTIIITLIIIIIIIIKYSYRAHFRRMPCTNAPIRTVTR